MQITEIKKIVFKINQLIAFAGVSRSTTLLILGLMSDASIFNNGPDFISSKSIMFVYLDAFIGKSDFNLRQLLSSMYRNSSNFTKSDLAMRTIDLAFILPLAQDKKELPPLCIYTNFPFESQNKLIRVHDCMPKSSYKYEDIFIDRFKSFSNTTLNVASKYTDVPLIYLQSVNDSEWKGTNVKILKAFAEKLDFTFTLSITPPDGENYSKRPALTIQESIIHIY